MAACHPSGSKGSADSSASDSMVKDAGGSIDGGTSPDASDAQNAPETGVSDGGEQSDVSVIQDASEGDTGLADSEPLVDTGADAAVDALADAGCTPSQEICNDEDDDCDGEIDESFPERGEGCVVPCALGACTDGEKMCVDGELDCVSIVQPAPEDICNNGIDDNCDGTVDKGPNCFANCNVGAQIPLTPGPLYGNGSPLCAPNPRGDQAVEHCAPDQSLYVTCPAGYAVCE